MKKASTAATEARNTPLPTIAELQFTVFLQDEPPVLVEANITCLNSISDKDVSALHTPDNTIYERVQHMIAITSCFTNKMCQAISLMILKSIAIRSNTVAAKFITLPGEATFSIVGKCTSGLHCFKSIPSVSKPGMTTM